MEDVLLRLVSASPHETASGPSYRWNNRVRKTGGSIFQFTWTGRGCLQRGGRIQSCGPGQALVMQEGDATSYFYPAEDRGPWTYTWINFQGAAPLWRELIRRHGDVASFDPEGETITLLRQLARGYWEKTFLDRYHASETLGRFLASMARELAGGGAARCPPVQAALDYFRDHHRRPINIKEVAARLGLSREHFTRLYTAETGVRPAAALRALRLQTARQLLRTTRLPIHEVAGQSGFGSATHFCRAFRLVEGTSPESYRRQARLSP